MRNKLTDLNNHLFETLERLNDDELTGKNLLEEIDRSRAVSSIAKNIIDNSRVKLYALRLLHKSGSNIKVMSKEFIVLGVGENENKS